MAYPGESIGERRLSGMPIPPFSNLQIDYFTAQLHHKPAGTFSPKASAEINKAEGQSVLAVDWGGRHLRSAIMTVSQGKVEEVIRYPDVRSRNGEEYIGAFISLAEEAGGRLPVGISAAGDVEGTRQITSANVPVFRREFLAHFGEFDYAKLFPNTILSVSNDAIAALRTGSLLAAERFPEIKQVLLLINGSGIGGAALRNNNGEYILTSAEPGHVEIAPALNRLGLSVPCSENEQITCIENIGGGGGTERAFDLRGKSAPDFQYFYPNSKKPVTGEQMSLMYQRGDNFAVFSYDDSAVIMAHVAMGMGETLGLLRKSGDTAIVYHGGTFNVPGFGRRVTQVLESYLGFPVDTLQIQNNQPDAGLVGAAIGALTAKS